MAKPLDITGMRYGRLIALEFVRRRHGHSYWKLKCDCGRETIVSRRNLLSLNTQSCGCLQRELASAKKSTHGKRYSSEYSSWSAMKNRCFNPKCPKSKLYSERGITVCQRWVESFEAFYEDMGDKPTPKHSLDRYPDNDGNYEPGNCRWATPLEQRHNQREYK